MRDSISQASYGDYDYISRYAQVPQYFNYSDQRKMMGRTRQLLATTAYVLHKVQSTDTYDSLALKYYNNPTLYWVILDYNRIIDAYSTPSVGEMLRIPVLSGIEMTGRGLR